MRLSSVMLTALIVSLSTSCDDGATPSSDPLEPSDYSTLAPAKVLVLDGAYSTRPELADLIDLAVLVDAPIAVRHARFAAREGAQSVAEWYARWDVAEAHYFSQVRPLHAFAWVVRNGAQ